MANVDELFDSSTESSFYIDDGQAKPKNTFIPAVPGTYFGHIIEMQSNVYDIKKGEHKARIYNFYVELAKENEGTKYTVDGKEVDGKIYAGRKIRSDGVFRFLEPGPSDTFSSNSKGNIGYLKFCESIGIKCNEVEKELSNGEKVKVKQLPSITEEDVLGKPVKAVVKYGKPYTNNKGFETTPLIVKYINAWKEGTAKKIEKVDLNEMPF